MRNKQLFSLMLCTMMILTSGCWNKMEISDLAIVSAIGVDKADENNEYRVFFQVANPSAVASGEAAGGGGGGVGGATQTITVYRGIGPSIFDAVRNASKMSSRRIYLSHARLIVFGESLAEEGIGDLFDYLKRSNEIRLTTDVVIAKGMTAESLMSVSTRFEKIPADAILGKLRFTSRVFAENVETKLYDVLKAVMDEGTEAVINGAELVEKSGNEMGAAGSKDKYSPPSIQINQMAVFHGGKLKFWLNDGPAKGFSWILNKMKRTVVTINFNEKKDSVSIDVIRSKTKVKVNIRNDKLYVDILVRLEAAINNVKSSINLKSDEVIEEMERSMDKKIQEEIMEVVHISKKEKVDFLSFGERLIRVNPSAWKKMEQRWNEVLSEAEVNVNVQSHIRQSGMNLEPVLTKKDGEK
jgi:spore germination protein KC